MTWLHAGLYEDSIQTASGRPAASTSVTVTVSGTQTLATLYADRDRSVALANPLSTDSLGNLSFYTEPGRYVAAANGGRYLLSVFPDAADLVPGGVSSVNGLLGPDIVLSAANVGADSAGAATSALSGHVAAGDPHPQYLTAAEGNAAYDATGAASGAVTAHTVASDPHGDRAAAAAALASHEADTTNIHGIADTSALETATGSAAKVTAHTGASDPHADRAFTTSAVSTHAGASDPHGDRAFTTSAVSAHAGSADPHGDRAYAVQRANHTGSQLAATISDFNTAVRLNRLDQLAAPTAAVSANSQKITSLATGTSSGDAVNKGQLDLKADLAGGTFTGPLRINTTSNTDSSLPLGRPGSTDSGLDLIGSFVGGEDDPGGTDFDSTARINFYNYQRASDRSYGEQIRMFAMRANAKSTLAWYKPRSGYDGSLVPIGSQWDPVAWIVGHIMSNDDPTVAHNHLSIELPDSVGAVQTRLEFPFGLQGTGVDQTVRGLDHVNIKSNLADFTIRAAGSSSYSGGRIGVLRIGGSTTYDKVLEFSTDAETGASASKRWRIVGIGSSESGSDAGSDLAVQRFADAGSLTGTAMFVRRQDGNVAFGQGTAEAARVAAIWGTSGHHGFYAKPSSTPGSAGAFSALLTATTDRFLDLKVATDTVSRFVSFGDGALWWGDGSSTRDTSLYRPTATPATLKTDGTLLVGAALTATGTLTAGDVAGGALAANVLPTDHSLKGWVYDPSLPVNSSALPAGVLQLVRIYLRKATTITNILYGVNAAATSPTSAQNFVALYDGSGNLLSASADQTTNYGSSGLKTTALGVAQSVAAGAYWVAFLFNGSTGPTVFRMQGGSLPMANAGLSASTARFGSILTGQTSMPSSITPASISTAGGITYWAALS